jgi:hypothetical protein
MSFLTVRQATRRYPTMVDQAMRAELTQLRERGTFVPVHGAPKGEKVVHSSLMMTPKFGVDGEMTLMKGRLVAAGNEVDPSVLTYDEQPQHNGYSLGGFVPPCLYWCN